MLTKRISLALIASAAVVFSLAAQPAMAIDCLCLCPTSCNMKPTSWCNALPGCTCVGNCAVEGDADLPPTVASPADYAGDFEEFGASMADEAADCDEVEIVSTE